MFSSVRIAAPHRFVDGLTRARGLRLRRTNWPIVNRADVHFFPSPAQLLRNAAFNSILSLRMNMATLRTWNGIVNARKSG
jgi:hypothetical protein